MENIAIGMVCLAALVLVAWFVRDLVKGRE